MRGPQASGSRGYGVFCPITNKITSRRRLPARKGGREAGCVRLGHLQLTAEYPMPASEGRNVTPRYPPALVPVNAFCTNGECSRSAWPSTTQNRVEWAIVRGLPAPETISQPVACRVTRWK